MQLTTKADVQKTVKLCRGSDQQGFSAFFAVESRGKIPRMLSVTQQGRVAEAFVCVSFEWLMSHLLAAASGDLYFEKAVNGFLSDLFAKWKVRVSLWRRVSSLFLSAVSCEPVVFRSNDRQKATVDHSVHRRSEIYCVQTVRQLQTRF